MAAGDKKSVVMVPSTTINGDIPVFGKNGQLISSGKNTSDFSPAPLTRSLTLYVNSNTGDDSNTGTELQPFQTIMQAINSVPKNIGGNAVTINVAGGSYPETVNISGFYGANYLNLYGIKIVGESRESVNISGGIAAYGCRIPILFQDFSVIGPVSINAVSARQCHYIKCRGLNIDGSALTGSTGAIYFEESNATLYDISVSNVSGGPAVTANECVVFVNSLTGSNNTIGIRAGNSGSATPGLIVAGTVTLTADTKYQKIAGGAIIENGVLV